MKISSIIFDMDGVLIDTESIHKLGTLQTLAQFGVIVTDEQYGPYRGQPDTLIMAGLVNLISEPRPSVQELLRLKDAHYAASEHLAAPIPGAVDFVLWAREHYKIALATSCSPRNCKSALQMLGLQDAFQCIVDRGAVTHPKPHPEVYLKAAAGIGSAPCDCLAIEDSLNGLAAAKAAGCIVVALTTSFPKAELRELSPEFIVDSFSEVTNLLY
ncbi:MAG: hypothetical protein CXZ00_05790 [Acidobacteria bacterium]|nr:MAG: hypothetical protein CXZ00_05790 [Acidobacteriota bacterium]